MFKCEVLTSCITCGTCETACPTGAIGPSPEIDVDNYVIDQDVCIGCGRCADVCPLGAIDNEEIYSIYIIVPF